jgi:hypothetical protein
MNAHDTNNLLFLMTLNPRSLEDWFLQADEDDRLYAEQLMAEAHLVAVDARVAQLPQFKEANKVLDKFRV